MDEYFMWRNERYIKRCGRDQGNVITIPFELVLDKSTGKTLKAEPIEPVMIMKWGEPAEPVEVKVSTVIQDGQPLSVRHF